MGSKFERIVIKMVKRIDSEFSTIFQFRLLILNEWEEEEEDHPTFVLKMKKIVISWI